MTGQTMMILLISLCAGAFAAGSTWVGIDVLTLLGGRLAARREKKRLQAEAKALKKAEEAANAKE